MLDPEEGIVAGALLFLNVYIFVYAPECKRLKCFFFFTILLFLWVKYQSRPI